MRSPFLQALSPLLRIWVSGYSRHNSVNYDFVGRFSLGAGNRVPESLAVRSAKLSYHDIIVSRRRGDQGRPISGPPSELLSLRGGFSQLSSLQNPRRSGHDDGWRARVGTRGDTNKTVGGSNLNLINAESRDDCVHKGAERPPWRDLLWCEASSARAVIYIDIYAAS